MRIRLLLALALVLAACSGGDATETTDTTAPTTTTPPTTAPDTTSSTRATTSTTIDDRPRSPLNGMPVDDAALLDRRVLAVKIDNHWNARPQSGILDADAVFEIRVEGGLTRFMAVFNSSDSEMLGPIRSGRPSDAAIVRPLESVLAISGGQAWIRAGINAVGVPYISDPRPGMFRISGRSAPHNLYGSTTELRGVADSRSIPDEAPPVSLWNFGDLPEDTEDAAEISFTFSGETTTTWTWDGETYLREINNTVSNWVNAEGETNQIEADVLVAIVGRQYVASPPAGSSGSSVPATDTTGSGKVYVFSEGKVATGTWERATASDPFTLSTDNGDELTVPAGFPWISIVPDSGKVSYEATVSAG